MRRILPLAILTAALAFPAGGQALTVGVSDQQASTFSNPQFAPLKMKVARYITPYDVMDSPGDRANLEGWLMAARGAHQRILVSFEHSYRGSKAKRKPSVSEFTREMKKFHKAFPFVRDISPWNEVNRCQFRLPDGSYQGQPTCRDPKRVAQYYMAARKVFRGDTIVGIDLLDQNRVGPSIKYLRTFLKYAKPTPKVIGLHNYSDTNRFSSSRTRAVLRAYPRGQVWLTETGGIVTLGTSFPYNLDRAKKALGCMFTIARSNKRITRLYIYQFNPAQHPQTDRFDAGLINPDGSQRPGYAVVQHRKASRCHK
ncbi:MAG TPA: hypothetical protein VFT42_06740 [Solirubrobacteraceae bacterium]|nr:hypothetical protein [Solirubrobacteraceae bacterium]